jgi:SAM-dependent methyltransferase
VTTIRLQPDDEPPHHGSNAIAPDRSFLRRGAQSRMTLDESILWMRSQPAFAAVVRDAYLGPDLEASARRFFESGEFAATRAVIGARCIEACVLDLGAGTGIASRAWLSAGASKVIAVEPDPSDLVGRGALQRLCAALPVEILPDSAERLSVPDGCVDLVYARQVLHHLSDLDAALRECYRVLRPGGIFLACREHVVDDASQLRSFLARHPVHQLAGGENAYSAAAYRSAIDSAGLQLKQEFGLWDSVINAYPAVGCEAELPSYPRRALEKKLGVAGRLVAALPGVQMLAWKWLRRARPGRMHTFLAIKP